jgi:hypothetical protein
VLWIKGEVKYENLKINPMKPHVRILAGVFSLVTMLSVSAQVSHVQYDLIYNAALGLYEAHAYVVDGSLIYPSTIPFPTKFSVVVPASIDDSPFTVVQNVNPPGNSWSQSNSVYAPAAAPNNDFHAFVIPGGGGSNAYPMFSSGTDILLFRFSVPSGGVVGGIRCYINGTDPNSAQPGMNGIDFSQSFKTANVERYIPGANVRISGLVLYNGNPECSMNGVTVQLRNSSGVIIGTAMTTINPVSGQPGYFAFNNIPDGTGYKLAGSYSGAWGGNNATDALIVQHNITGQFPLSGLNEIAADVNASSTISALDALYIKLRTVESISSFPAGDWKISEPVITLSGGAITQNLTALCTGDVNGSFNPNVSKSAPSMSVIDDGVLTIPAGEPFAYNIRSSRSANIGAMTLFLGYDQDRYEVSDITSAYEGLKYVINNGNIAVAWSDTKPLKVNANDLVLSLKMQVKTEISEPSRVFAIRSASEFADIGAIPYESFNLKMQGVMTIGGSKGLAIFNYPNPFVDNTTIVYTLPEPGRVRLVLTDLYGKTISRLADHKDIAGIHTVPFDPSGMNLMPGVYLCKILFDGTTGTEIKVDKMLFTR